MKRKGSLSLSIEAIVIVVIAFVVLGLGLGFVKGQFKSITETSTSVQEQVRQQVLEDLRTGDKKLSFPATTLNINAKEAQDIAIGVKNTKDLGDLKFGIGLETVSKQGEEDYNSEEAGDLEYFFLSGPYTLEQTEAEAYNIKIISTGSKGTYLVRLKIFLSDDTGNQVDPTAAPYAEKSFFVNVI